MTNYREWINLIHWYIYTLVYFHAYGVVIKFSGLAPGGVPEVAVGKESEVDQVDDAVGVDVESQVSPLIF